MTRILVIDNDIPAQEKITQYLHRRGVSTDVAADPMTAFSYLSSVEYDYVFLDMDLGAGISDGEGILSWMDRHKKRIRTLLISEAANQPNVIRVEKAYSDIVMFRMTHSDLDYLSDLIDHHLFPRDHAPAPSAKATPVASDGQAAGAGRILVISCIAMIALMASLAMIYRSAAALGFVQVVVASILVFLLVAVVTLTIIGRITEKGFRGVIELLLKKIPSLKGGKGM